MRDPVVAIPIPVVVAVEAVARDEVRSVVGLHEHSLRPGRVSGQRHGGHPWRDLNGPADHVEPVKYRQPRRRRPRQVLVGPPVQRDRAHCVLQLLILHGEPRVQEEVHVRAVIPVEVSEHDVAHVRRVDPGLVELPLRLFAFRPLERVAEVLPDERGVGRARVHHDWPVASGDHEHDHRQRPLLVPVPLVGHRGVAHRGDPPGRQRQNLQAHCAHPSRRSTGDRERSELSGHGLTRR